MDYISGGIVLRMKSEKVKPTIGEANIIYLIAMVLLIIIGSIVQRWSFNYGILITEFILIAMPPIVYCIIRKYNLKYVFRINKMSAAQTSLVITIFLSGYFVAVFLNLIGNIILSMFGKLNPQPIPVAQNPSEYFILLLIIACSAGLCEEILFRGLLLRAYENIGMWNSIIINALLFGMLHLNIQNFVGPAFLGLLLSFVVYQTNSIFAGMLGHFINNAVSVTLQYAIMSLPVYKGLNTNLADQSIDTASLVASAVLFCVLSIFSGTIMLMSMKSLKDISHNDDKLIQTDQVGTLMKNIRISWPIYMTAIIFIAMTCVELLTITGNKM